MIDIETRMDEVNAQIDAFQGNIEGTRQATEDLNSEMARMRENMLFTRREVGSLSTSFGSDLKRAFDDVVFDGRNLSDALRQLGRSMAEAAYDAAMKPIQNTIGSAISGGINTVVGGILGAGGGSAAASILPFASGGVVSGPTYFPMRGGMGLMGEAGPEAIMPLARGADGRLGVRTQGSSTRPVQVTMNITTPDVEGFRRSQTQVATQMNRALSLAARNR
jgi:phage-related minor tail protein